MHLLRRVVNPSAATALVVLALLGLVARGAHAFLQVAPSSLPSSSLSLRRPVQFSGVSSPRRSRVLQVRVWIWLGFGLFVDGWGTWTDRPRWLGWAA